jgi:hypothetical protein
VRATTATGAAFPFSMTIQLQPWRLKPEPVTDYFRFWMCQNRTTQPDVFVARVNQSLFPPTVPILEFYHRNIDGSGVDDYFAWSMEHQGLSGAKNKIPNPIRNRQFGAVIYPLEGAQFVRESPLVLSSQHPNSTFSIAMTTHTNQTESVLAWEEQVSALMRSLPTQRDARKKHEHFWLRFWGTLFIYFIIY